MYGKYITIGDQKVWVWCTPSTSQKDLVWKALEKINFKITLN